MGKYMYNNNVIDKKHISFTFIDHADDYDAKDGNVDNNGAIYGDDDEDDDNDEVCGDDDDDNDEVCDDDDDNDEVCDDDVNT